MIKKEAMLILENAPLLIHIGYTWNRRIRYWSVGCGNTRGLLLTKTEAVSTVVQTKKALAWSYSGNTLVFWEKGKRDP